MDDTEENEMNKFQLWMINHAPLWIIKKNDPDGTFIRMILVILSFIPFFALLAFLYVAIVYF